MKLVAVAVLVLGLFCNSTQAMAEEPVPFNALMQPAGAQPSIPPLDDSKNQSVAGSPQSIHKPGTARSGKIMTGVGAGLAITGLVVVAGTALLSHFGSSGKVAAGFAAGGGAIAGGVTLVIFGQRREGK